MAIITYGKLRADISKTTVIVADPTTNKTIGVIADDTLNLVNVMSAIMNDSCIAILTDTYLYHMMYDGRIYKYILHPVGYVPNLKDPSVVGPATGLANINKIDSLTGDTVVYINNGTIYRKEGSPSPHIALQSTPAHINSKITMSGGVVQVGDQTYVTQDDFKNNYVVKYNGV